MASASVYVAMAFAPPTYVALLSGVVVVTAMMQFVSGAASAHGSGMPRHHAMSGQVSTSTNLAQQIPAALAALGGGALAGALEGATAQQAVRAMFLLGAALMSLIAAFGVFGPQRLFDEAETEAPTLSVGGDLLRLARTWAIYPALLIQLLYQFGPGFGVALQYHLSNAIHATDGQIGAFYMIFNLCFLPLYPLYGWLAQRYSLRVLLWVGAVLLVPQMAGLLFIHTPTRACGHGLLSPGRARSGGLHGPGAPGLPQEPRGSMVMLYWAMFWVAVTFGDLWARTSTSTTAASTPPSWRPSRSTPRSCRSLLVVPRSAARQGRQGRKLSRELVCPVAELGAANGPPRP